MIVSTVGERLLDEVVLDDVGVDDAVVGDIGDRGAQTIVARHCPRCY